ncbi:hypothetical protein [Neobacillus sp. FSL H8-0543]|uniref:hypothetical protein n=1 Tax=Neobacillus sp. FSL H8-0543 TaxID=2954672 RepID=UPI003159699E
MPIFAYDTTAAKKAKVFARKVKTTEFVKALAEGLGLSYIRKQYMGTLSARAFADLESIQRLYMAGATFQEINRFLDERPAYWAEEEKMNNRLSTPVEEFSLISFSSPIKPPY